MALSDMKRRLPAICVAAAAVFALAACDEQNAAQQNDTTVPQADQQLGELPSATEKPVPADPIAPDTATDN